MSDLFISELAVIISVSRQTINAIETGKFDPSLPLAFKISRLFVYQSRTFSRIRQKPDLAFSMLAIKQQFFSGRCDLLRPLAYQQYSREPLIMSQWLTKLHLTGLRTVCFGNAAQNTTRGRTAHHRVQVIAQGS